MNAVKVERFAPNPDHGRPKLAAFSSPAGELAVHCERATGALWLFASGPRGGDRGQVVVSVRNAEKLLAWIAAPHKLMAYGGGHGWITLREDRVIVGMSGWSRQWKMELDAAARDALLACLREWAATASEWAGS